MEGYISSGFNAVMPKPFNHTQVRIALSAVCGAGPKGIVCGGGPDSVLPVGPDAV